MPRSPAWELDVRPGLVGADRPFWMRIHADGITVSTSLADGRSAVADRTGPTASFGWAVRP